MLELLRYVAFTKDPAGGNPAGVVLDATGVDASVMLATAAEVGFSETSFVVPRQDGAFDVRYFSPRTEVPFCGHATVATAVAYADLHGPGELLFHTKAGPVPVRTARGADGTLTATLVSVPPRSMPLLDEDLGELLDVLGWTRNDLASWLTPAVAYAGAWHPVLAAATRARLAALDYDMASLDDLMRRNDWTTIDLVWRASPTVYHARNPFPPGGVVEDPATGAAAAAFGGLLQECGHARPGASLTVLQGEDMGRPSTITVTLPDDPAKDAGIAISGTAVAM